LLPLLAAALPGTLSAVQPKAATRNLQLYRATVRTTECREDKSAVTLAAPTVTFAAGKNVQIRIGDEARACEIVVGTSSDSEPAMNWVQVRIIDAPMSKNPTAVAAPKLSLANGMTGTIKVGNLTVAATVERAK
jgi:hypothetical protein